MGSKVFEVPPLSRSEIRELALTLRKVLNINTGPFPIMDFVEFILPSLDKKFELNVLPVEQMGTDFGRTYPRGAIQLREDVYIAASNGDPIHRMTVAHEVGHYFLHIKNDLHFARNIANEKTPPYMSSEWQANCFGGELLVPYLDKNIISQLSIEDVMKTYGVSRKAATLQKQAICKGLAVISWQR